MIITFQVQIDPLVERDFTRDELNEISGEMNVFCSRLEKFKEYIRCQMCVDGKVWRDE